MGEAVGVRDLARGVRRAGVPSSTAGVERPADVVGAVRGVVERRAEAAAWSGVAGAPSVAFMVLATSAAGAGTAVGGVGCDTAAARAGATSSVRSFFSAGAGESSPRILAVLLTGARRSGARFARRGGGGGCGGIDAGRSVITRAGVATAALQGDCAGVATGVVEDMAVGSAECLRRESYLKRGTIDTIHVTASNDLMEESAPPAEIKAEHQRVKRQWLCCVGATRNEWWSLC
jgi:hypothetical protein